MVIDMCCVTTVCKVIVKLMTVINIFFSGSSRAFIICRVLVGRKMFGSACLNIPDKGYDTAVGPRTKELIYVKFRDTECLPLYVAYYNDSKYYESKYNVLPRHWFN